MTDRPTRRWLAALLLGGTCVSLSSQLWAERNTRPGLLWGSSGATPKALVAIDPLLPTGTLQHVEPRPQGLQNVACGLRQPVCVHYGADVPVALAQAYLTAMEDARAFLVGVLGLPAPLGDLGFGPTPGLDMYLLAKAANDLVVAGDRRWQGSDRVSAYCRAHPLRDGYRRQAHQCVGEAILLGLDAAETPQLRQAIASYLWGLAGQPSSADYQAVDDLQANPQLGVIGRESQPDSLGAALLWRYADRRLGAGRPGTLPTALLGLSRSETPLGAVEWNNAPDAVDVLRAAFDASEQRFDDFMLGFAVERAFLGSRDNGQHDPQLVWLGDAARVRFDWVIQASSLPRRVAPRRPLEPFGAAYFWLALDRVRLDASLAFRAEWETPVTFRWTLVAIDAGGNALQRYDLPLVQNATSAERTLVNYADAAAILIVGTNLGGVDLAHPFDPDREPFEPHGFTIYLAEL